MSNYSLHQREVLGDIFLELVSDDSVEAHEIAKIILDELEDIQLYHKLQSEKTAIIIEALGGHVA